MAISPESVQRYLKARGWQWRREALNDRGLYWFENPNLYPRQITFLSDEKAPDYADSIYFALVKLAEAEETTLPSLQNSIQEAGDDTLNFRLFGDRVQSESLPFAFFTDALNGARELLLSAAHTVLAPRLSHPRLGRREALEFLNSTGFGQTALGSFVFKLTCPIAETLSLFPTALEQPFARRATLAVNHALHALSDGLRYDTLPELVDAEQKREQPLLSANFCEALTRLQDEKLENALDISFSWAVTITPPEFATKENRISFDKDDFKRIAEVGTALRMVEGAKDDLFLATVESLNGIMGRDGRRFGEVIFRLFLSEEDAPIRAKAELSSALYAQADKAHMTDGAHVLFHAKLHPGRQPRRLSDIEGVEIFIPSGSSSSEIV
ncbi:hypothetical protein IAD21_02233 [Abditibacteriota bacterium]|nr:hypothetical protein IAD21_02233 [Abditibacteriota bacterium]